MMSSANDDDDQVHSRRLLPNCLAGSINRSALLVLLLVHQASGWRVLESGHHHHSNLYKNLTKGREQVASQELELDSSGWRFLSDSNSIPAPSPRHHQEAPRSGRAGSNGRAPESTNSSVDPLRSGGVNHGHAVRSKSGAPIEWDDEDANEGADEDGDAPAVEADMKARRNLSVLIRPLAGDHRGMFGQPIVIGAGGPKVIDPFRFELKDSGQNSINKIGHISPYQLTAASNSKYAGKYFAGRPLSASKLIYHGQLNAVSDGSKIQKRFVAGIEMHIDTHKPVVINRRSFSAPLTNSSAAVAPVRVTGNTTSADELTATFRVGPSGGGGGGGDEDDDERETDMYSTSATLKSNPFTTSPSAGHMAPTQTSQNSSRSAVSVDSSAGVLASVSQEAASSSDWRPIVVSSRMRRSGKTRTLGAPESLSTISSASFKFEAGNEPASGHAGDKLASLKPRSALARKMDTKWRPITAGRASGAKSSSASSSPVSSELKRSSIWAKSSPDGLASFKGFRSMKKGSDVARRIEQPFDREEDEEPNERDDEEFKVVSSGGAAWDSLDMNNQLNSRINADKWTPLETTTPNSSDILMSSSSTTIASVEPMTSTSASRSPKSAPSGNATASETAQRSASDLSYIYSSQPQQQVQQQQPTSSGSSYYSNYLVPAQPSPQADLPQQITPTIIDTTSGATPEMVPDRSSIESQPGQPQYDYSVAAPQPMALQPVQATPSRQPAYYGSYGGGSSFDSGASNSFYQPARAFQAQQQQQAQPTRQSLQPSSAPQVLKQEHHYHYYNQPTPSFAADRQRSSSLGQTPPTTPAPIQPTVIRELQPIMISQPVIQQQQPVASTTQAPTQIIREIIKEVPMQSVQVQPVQMPTRFIVQQAPPPPPPIPVIPPIPSIIRDGAFEPLSSYEAPARRLMRQISESMPQVAIRMPSQPPFRFQTPAAQLANQLRASSPSAAITRQTGSFIVPPMPKKTTTLMTETQEVPLHTTIIHSTQYTPATRTTVYTTDHQTAPVRSAGAYRK